MQQHRLAGRTVSGGVILTGTQVDGNGIPCMLSVEPTSTSKTWNVLIAAALGAVGLFSVVMGLVGLAHEPNWVVPTIAIGVAAGALFAAAAGFLWLNHRRRFFVRTPDGFGCFSSPWGLRTREYRWEDVEWIGIRQSTADQVQRYRQLTMKLRTSWQPAFLISDSGAEAVMALLMSWGGDRWQEAPRKWNMPRKFVRVA